MARSTPFINEAEARVLAMRADLMAAPPQYLDTTGTELVGLNRYGSGRTLMLRKCVSLPGSCPCKANVPLPKSRSSSPGLRCE
jgi:hypothetical protein